MIVRDINPGTEDPASDTYRQRGLRSAERERLTARQTDLLIKIRTDRNRLLQLESNAGALGSQFRDAEQIPVLRNRLIGLERELSDIEYGLRVTDTERVDYIEAAPSGTRGTPSDTSSQERLSVRDVTPPPGKKSKEDTKRPEAQGEGGVTRRSTTEQRTSARREANPSQRSQDVALANAGAQQSIALIRSLGNTYKTVATTYEQVRGARTKELTEVNLKAAKKVKPPSKVRYSLFIGTSLLVDIFISPAVTAAWATVIFGILATVALAIVMWLAGFILLGRRGKEAAKHRKELQKQSKNLQRDIQMVQQEYRSFLQWLKAVGERFPQIAARATSTAAKAGRIVGKYKLVRRAGQLVNWLSKGWFKQGSEAIPIWNVLPWWTIGAIASYLSHRGDWYEAQDILGNFNDNKKNMLGLTDTMYQTRLAVIADMATEANSDTMEEAPQSRPTSARNAVAHA